MAAPTSPFDLDTTASNNQPPASEGLSSGDDQIRALAACVKQLVVKGADIASAGTITPAATASFFDITGTKTITAIGSSASWDGRVVWLQFDGALTLNHSSTLKLPGAVNYTTAAGDVLAFVQETSGTWRCLSVVRAARTAFRARVSAADQTSGTTILFDTEDFDYGSNYNPATGLFTCVVPGDYLFCVGAVRTNSAGTYAAEIDLLKNSSVQDASILFIGAGTRGTHHLSAIISLVAGDTVSVVSAQTLSANDSILASPATFFSGKLLSNNA